MKNVYEVVPAGSQWALRRRGSDEKEMFETRHQAIASGREVCAQNRPSRLRIRKVTPEAQN